MKGYLYSFASTLQKNIEDISDKSKDVIGKLQEKYGG